jgi:hypothetical protein
VLARIAKTCKAFTRLLESDHTRPRHRIAEIFGGRPSLFGELAPILWAICRRIWHMPSLTIPNQRHARIVFHSRLNLGKQMKARAPKTARQFEPLAPKSRGALAWVAYWKATPRKLIGDSLLVGSMEAV